MCLCLCMCLFGRSSRLVLAGIGVGIISTRFASFHVFLGFFFVTLAGREVSLAQPFSFSPILILIPLAASVLILTTRMVFWDSAVALLIHTAVSKIRLARGHHNLTIRSQCPRPQVPSRSSRLHRFCDEGGVSVDSSDGRKLGASRQLHAM